MKGEGSSGSEEENSEDDSDSRDQTINRCQHCFSTSEYCLYSNSLLLFNI